MSTIKILCTSCLTSFRTTQVLKSFKIKKYWKNLKIGGMIQPSAQSPFTIKALTKMIKICAEAEVKVF